MKSNLIDLDLEFERETPRAIGVLVPAGGLVWLPKSQIDYEVPSRGRVDVTLPLWLAREKGLVE